MTKLMQQKTCSILISLAIACAVMSLAVIAVLISEQSFQERQLNKAYSFVRSVVDDANDALDELNALPYETCDQRTLIAMQQTLFNSHFLKEVGFLENGALVCTTSGGVLKEPISEPEATFLTARKTKVIVDHPLQLFEFGNTPNSAVIVELGSYNVVIHGGYLDFIDLPLQNIQIAYREEHKSHHIYGTSGLFRDDRQWASYSEFDVMQGLYSQQCDPDLGYCAITLTAAAEIIKANRLQLVSSILIVMIILWFVLKKTYPFKARLSSLKYRIRAGAENEAFYPTFQPIVELETEKIIGCEVLGRFQDSFGPLYPDQFIPLLKEYELTWEYTILQVNQVCTALTQLDLPNRFKLGFNVFPEDLTASNVNELIATAKPYLNEFEINFEIIEDQVLDEFEAKEQIRKLAAEGFSISIDDFGTGYSNLGQLESINCHYLKIDRQFIGDIEKGSLLSSLVPQIGEIANRFKLECVAEGIENSMQKDLILEQGIKYGQGWYFGKPMPIEQWAVFVGARHSAIDVGRSSHFNDFEDQVMAAK